MNLLAKSLGQLAVLAVALFFFSCEDPTSLGFENPSNKFDVRFIDIPLSSTVVPIEDIITDNKSSEDIMIYVGQHHDPLMGHVSASSYLQFARGFSSTVADTTVYDSIVIQLRLNLYSYGFTGNSTQKFSIHAITGDSLVRISPDANNPIRYYNSSTIAYDPNAIGEASVSVDVEKLTANMGKAFNQQDTFLVRTRLDDSFGQQLFAEARANKFDSIADFRRFFWEFKGLALVPDASTNGVIGFNAFNSLSRITVYYHNANGTAPKELIYAFNSPSFTNFNNDRGGTELAGATPFQAIDPPSGLRYIQNGNPVITKVDLSNFYSFADQDSAQNILINSAEFIIENSDQPEAYQPISSYTMRVLREDNRMADVKVAEDSTALVGYYVTNLPLNYYVVPDIASANNPVAIVSYDKTKKRSSTFITSFTHNLVKNRTKNGQINSDRLMYLGLYAASPAISRGVTRTVFHKDNIKLRIYYTRPTNINQ